MNSAAGSWVSTVNPSQPVTVSPDGTVLASGFWAGPQMPFGKADPGRRVMVTASRSNAWPVSDVTVTVRPDVIDAAYIGATPRPGVDTDCAWDPAGLVSVSCWVGTVETKLIANSGTTRNGRAAVPSGGLATPPEPGSLDRPAVSPPLTTEACTIWASWSPRRYLRANSSALSARSAGLLVVAELERDADAADREVALDMDRRTRHVDVEAEGDVDVDAAEQQPDRDADPRLGIHRDLEPERVEEDDAVAAEVERRVGRTEVRGDVASRRRP